MSTGLLDAGIEVRAGFDNDRSSIEAFDYNHSYRGCFGHVSDLSEASGRDLLRLAGIESVDLVSGGPPCQPFSIAGKQHGLEDRRGNLIFEFLRLIEELAPRAVVFENVPNLARIENGDLLGRITGGLIDLGYQTSQSVLLAADYGVAQNRKRLVVLGVRDVRDAPSPPAATHSAIAQGDLFAEKRPHVSVREVLDDLPDVAEPAAGEIANHEPTFHTPRMLDAFARLEPGRRDRKSFHDRLHPDRPSYTLRAGSGNFSPLRPVHYRYDRVISVRESARIQGFADDFVWPDTIPRLQQYRQVGNAVPPPLARALGEHLAGLVGWRLRPSDLRGDPASRPPAIDMTPQERLVARAKYVRGESLDALRGAVESAA